LGQQIYKLDRRWRLLWVVSLDLIWKIQGLMLGVSSKEDRLLGEPLTCQGGQYVESFNWRKLSAIAMLKLYQAVVVLHGGDSKDAIKTCKTPSLSMHFYMLFNRQQRI
jgi:hypothetical protein